MHSNKYDEQSYHFHGSHNGFVHFDVEPVYNEEAFVDKPDSQEERERRAYAWRNLDGSIEVRIPWQHIVWLALEKIGDVMRLQIEDLISDLRLHGKKKKK